MDLPIWRDGKVCFGNLHEINSLMPQLFNALIKDISSNRRPRSDAAGRGALIGSPLSATNDKKNTIISIKLINDETKHPNKINGCI